ncbi:E3 ubiquitin-protein ligase TRIM63-like [Sardina pilchardus]|uniref:E3 ubiquitin-protein ligase TRIM63-like n=1 Tax=Sardina pilchardus TaxID=27697 RepID=UPI002E13FA12
MCRKVTHLRSKGINGLKRNLFAENVLDKLKQEIEEMAKEELIKKDICPQHKEEENLYCLTDNQPICTTCKIFGDHSTHEVAKISDMYKLRKELFDEQMKMVLSKCDAHANIIQELGHNMELLLFSKKHTQDYVKKVGNSLIWEIQMKVSALIMRIEAETDIKSELMQRGLEVLYEPKRLYDEMLQHGQSKTPLEFLKKEVDLRGRAEKLVLVDELGPQCRDYVSHGKYVEELMSGFEMETMGKITRKSLVRKLSKILKEWKSDRKHFDDTAYRSLDLILEKNVFLEQEQDSKDSLAGELWRSEEDIDAKEGAIASKAEVHQQTSKCNV